MEAVLPVENAMISEKELLEPVRQTARSMKVELQYNVQWSGNLWGLEAISHPGQLLVMFA